MALRLEDMTLLGKSMKIDNPPSAFKNLDNLGQIGILTQTLRDAPESHARKVAERLESEMRKLFLG